MTDGSIVSADGSNSSGPIAPRISLPSGLASNLSYADLFETHVRENDLPVEEDSSALTTHHYPAIMQSMITRLEKYGRLANMPELTRHSKGAQRAKKTKVEGQESGSEDSDPNDRYYDLDDWFIAPEDELERENEGEFEEALKEGHFILRPDQFVPVVSRAPTSRSRKAANKQNATSANPGRKKKAKAMTTYPDEIRKQLFTLKDLYEKNKKENTAVAFPKGSVKLINDVMSLMVSDPVNARQTVERADLCLTLSEITEQPLSKIENIASKQLSSNDKSKLASEYLASCKKLKSLVTAECKTQLPAWTQDLKDAYAKCQQALQASVRKTNDFNAIYHKKKPTVTLVDEERKLEKEVSEMSGGRFLVENSEVRVVEKPPTQLPQPQAPPVSSKTETKALPQRSSTFDPMPE